jgi:FkbM family methyltransferase
MKEMSQILKNLLKRVLPLPLIQLFRKLSTRVKLSDTNLLARRMKLLDSHGVDVVLDVGANEGQYAKELRCNGYKGRIISFEPLNSAYKLLAVSAKADGGTWDTFNMALGDKLDDVVINIAGNSYSSSILEMLDTHLNAAPQSEYIGQEQVKLVTLDSIFDSLSLKGKKIFLKIDTQGFEENVLKGAENSLRLIDIIQLEMSLKPLYRGELLFPEMYALLCGKGYHLFSIEPGFSDPQTGALLQMDGIFIRF